MMALPSSLTENPTSPADTRSKFLVDRQLLTTGPTPTRPYPPTLFSIALTLSTKRAPDPAKALNNPLPPQLI